MKKLLSLFLICSMYLGITACSKNNSKNDTSNENKSKSYVEMTYGQTYTINDSNGNFDISIDKIVIVEDSNIFSTEWTDLKEDNYCIAVLTTVNNTNCVDWEPKEMTLSGKIFIETEGKYSLETTHLTCEEIDGYDNVDIPLGRKMRVFTTFIVPKVNNNIKIDINNQCYLNVNITDL